MEAVRTRFLREALESVERRLGASTLETLLPRVSERTREAIRAAESSTSPSDNTPLASAEEVLLAVDSVLGDGSGKELELIGSDWIGRILSQDGNMVVIGSLVGTLARLVASFEHPFLGMKIVFEVQRTDVGLSLTVGAAGHPRTTRILRHLAAGAIVAADRFAREAAGHLKLLGEVRGDRAVIDAHFRPEPPEKAPSEREPPKRPSRAAMRAVSMRTTLSDEIDQIFSQRSPGGSFPPRRAESSPPRRDSSPAAPPDSMRTKPTLPPDETEEETEPEDESD